MTQKQFVTNEYVVISWDTVKPRIQNNGISKFRFNMFFITVSNSSLIFIAFQPANIISVRYNVGKLTYSVN